ncbi:hypothetical protein CR513_15438, partial [Mucuna pruriens]
MKNTFDRRVRPWVFKEGDLVLRRRLPNVKDPRGKWAPNYEGPYVVKQAFSRGALVLVDLEGQELIHLERIRRINLQDFRMEESVPTDAKESVIDFQLKVLGPQLVLICTPETANEIPQGGSAIVSHVLDKNDILVTQHALIRKHAIPKTSKEDT